MKKTLVLILAFIVSSCSSEDDNIQIVPIDPIVGKWIIYKADYENTVYEYEINGQCGVESLEMLVDDNSVTATYYTNADCTTYTSTTGGGWRKEDNGEYNFFLLGETSSERNLILTGNEIKVTNPGPITVIKYYKRVL